MANAANPCAYTWPRRQRFGGTWPRPVTAQMCRSNAAECARRSSRQKLRIGVHWGFGVDAVDEYRQLQANFLKAAYWICSRSSRRANAFRSWQGISACTDVCFFRDDSGILESQTFRQVFLLGIMLLFVVSFGEPLLCSAPPCAIRRKFCPLCITSAGYHSFIATSTRVVCWHCSSAFLRNSVLFFWGFRVFLLVVACHLCAFRCCHTPIHSNDLLCVLPLARMPSPGTCKLYWLPATAIHSAYLLLGIPNPAPLLPAFWAHFERANFHTFVASVFQNVPHSVQGRCCGLHPLHSYMHPLLVAIFYKCCALFCGMPNN